MKKMICIVLTIVFTVIFTACSNGEEKNITFKANIDEVSEGYIRVAVDDEVGFDMADVGIKNCDVDFALTAGQVVEITVKPEIDESYPVHVEAESIKLIEDVKADSSVTENDEQSGDDDETIVNKNNPDLKNAENKFKNYLQGGLLEDLKGGIKIGKGGTVNENFDADKYNIVYKRESWREDGKDAMWPLAVNKQGSNNMSAGLPLIKIDSMEQFNEFKSKTGSLTSVSDDNVDFSSKSLFVIYITEGSGSVRHEVADVSIQNNRLNIAVKRKAPDIGTCDMAAWTISLQVDKSDIENCKSFDVSVYN